MSWDKQPMPVTKFGKIDLSIKLDMEEISIWKKHQLTDFAKQNIVHAQQSLKFYIELRKTITSERY